MKLMEAFLKIKANFHGFMDKRMLKCKISKDSIIPSEIIMTNIVIEMIGYTGILAPEFSIFSPVSFIYFMYWLKSLEYANLPIP